MKQIYELSQQLIAGLVIVSVFIQSCTGLTIATFSKEETSILEAIPQLNDQGPLNQLAATKFIAEKEDKLTSALQAEKFLNENHQGEALLTIKEEGKLEGQQEQKNEWDFAKDQTEQKVDGLYKVNKCNENVEARWLGDLEILPIEIVEKILTYVPCDKIRKERRGEEKVT